MRFYSPPHRSRLVTKMTVLLVILIAIVLVASWIFFRSRTPSSEQLVSEEKPQLKAATNRVAKESVAETIAEPAGPTASIPTEPAGDAELSSQVPATSAPILQDLAPSDEIEETSASTHDIEGLRKGLERSRRAEGFFGRLAALLRGKKEISPDIASEIEEVLLTSDVGVQTTQVITDRIRENLSKRDLKDPAVIWEAVRDEARTILRAASKGSALKTKGKPAVMLLVGVNGAGKTTTIGKLATRFKSQGRSVVLAAGDTFRAAAVQQLCVWGDRIGVEVVRGKDGADPGSVVFDAIRKAKECGIDIVLADTAGRLHTKSNLMAELKKVIKTTSRALDGTPFEVLLVVDATNGQNAVAQAKEFCAELPLTGMVLTKLDGTAKGGFVVGIAAALQLPVKLIGLGEKATDLHDFDPDDFVEALLGQAREGASA
jgi:fused signal recognition particle receptor